MTKIVSRNGNLIKLKGGLNGVPLPVIKIKPAPAPVVLARGTRVRDVVRHQQMLAALEILRADGELLSLPNQPEEPAPKSQENRRNGSGFRKQRRRR